MGIPGLNGQTGIILIVGMGQRKIWTEEEDKVLMEILEQRNIKKWSMVSKIMEQEYKMPGRSGKQCRERWYNQLDPSINNRPWGEAEEEILFRNHDNFGNRWARIAQDLPGRTDNAIKNHFYSTLRKAIRRLNRFISETKQKKQMREIKPLILSKIIVLSGDKGGGHSATSPEIVDRSIDIKKRLVAFAKQCEQEHIDENLMRNLVEDIMFFNGNYKRRNYSTKKNVQQQVKVEQTRPAEIEYPKISLNKVIDPPKIQKVTVFETSPQKPELNINLLVPNDKCLKTVRPAKLLSSSLEALLSGANAGFSAYKKPTQSEFPFIFPLQTYTAGVEGLNSDTGVGEQYTYSTKNGSQLLEGQYNLGTLSKVIEK